MAATPPRLDELDARLLDLLRTNARLPIAQLAKELGVSRTHLYGRLTRLEGDGTVAGYTVRLGSSYSANRVRAHMMIKTEPRCRRPVEAHLASLREIHAVYAISGENDIIAMIEAEDGRQLNDVVDTVGALEGVLRTTTSVILDAKLER